LYSIPLSNMGTHASFPYYPARVLCDGVNLQPYFNLETLKKFVLNEGYGINNNRDVHSSYTVDAGKVTADAKVDPSAYLKGPDQGYFYHAQENKLYVRLYADGRYTPENRSANPNDHVMKVSSRLYHKVRVNGTDYSGYRGTAIDTGSYNIGINIPNQSAHIIIDGFTLETPGVAGVYIRSNDVVVKNVKFSGCRAGVVGGARYTYENYVTENVTVSNCDYSQFPVFEEAAELINNYYKDSTVIASKFYWWQKKGLNRNVNIYTWLDYESGGFVGRMGRNWILENNYIHNVFDAIAYYGFTPYTVQDGREVSADGIIIRNNRFEKAVDNTIEFENHARNVSVYKNEFIDNYMPLSVQPLDGLPWPTNIYIYDNIISQDKYLGSMWQNKAKYLSAWIKFGTRAEQWDRISNLVGVSKTNIDFTENGTTDGIDIFNNTILTPYCNFFENVGSGSMNYIGLKIRNNIIQTNLTGKISNYNGVTMKTNILVPTNYETTFFQGGPALSGYFANSIENLMLNEDYTLSDLSPARFSGSQIGAKKAKGCDIGALQYGESYNIGVQ